MRLCFSPRCVRFIISAACSSSRRDCPKFWPPPTQSIEMSSNFKMVEETVAEDATGKLDEPRLGLIHFITQDDCFRHLFRREKDSSTIFERPERLRFVNLGLSAAIAWDLIQHPISQIELSSPQTYKDDDSPTPLISSSRVLFSKSIKQISNHDPAVLRIHDEINQPSPSAEPVASSSSALPRQNFVSNLGGTATYLDQLLGMCRQAAELNHLGLSEVPPHLPQGDLYLSTGSEAAIVGAIGACYTAVDYILGAENLIPVGQGLLTPAPNQVRSCTTSQKAFVNVRPPGHHCTNSEPMGFCWVNNVLISCMYSHLKYGIDRICIIDIDLHHGNGSQEIVWQLNDLTATSSDCDPAQTLRSKQRVCDDPYNAGHRDKSARRGLKISYSSLHDINSYPCEDLDPDRIKDASLNICMGNSINQYIQNLHLEDWVDEADFYERLYPKMWSAFKNHMLQFFQITSARPDQSLIFVSAGFDACEYETDLMSRYGKKLPASFYHRFARDISDFSDAHSGGKLISILEGGYSAETLVGSSLSYILGLMGGPEFSPKDAPWSIQRINQLLNLCQKPGPQNSARAAVSLQRKIPADENSGANDDRWLTETRRIFQHIDAYEQVKNDLSKQSKQEQKRIKIEQSMKQLSIAEQNLPEGTRRRSQRHASNSPNLTTPKDPEFNFTMKTSPAPSQAIGSGAQRKVSRITTGSKTQTSVKPADDQSINALFDNLSLTEPAAADSTNSAVTVLSAHTEQSADSIPPDNSQPPLPKIKLIWKAGGIYGMAPHSSDFPDKIADSSSLLEDNVSSNGDHT